MNFFRCCINDLYIIFLEFAHSLFSNVISVLLKGGSLIFKHRTRQELLEFYNMIELISLCGEAHNVDVNVFLHCCCGTVE